MIELFAGTTTTFTGRNGDVILLPTACSVTAEVNGVWELRLEHPLDEEGRWRYIATSAILRVPSYNGKQLFRIKRVDKSETAVVALADPIFFDAGNDCFMMDTHAVNKTAQEALNLIFSGSPAYSGLSDIQRTSTAYYVRKNALEAISGVENSILNRWGGELEYDNFTVKVMQRLGADRGVLVRTGKNLPRDGLKYAADESEVINRIVPLSYNGHKMSGSTPWVDASGVTAAIRHVGVVTFEDIRLAGDTGYSSGETVPDYITVCENQAELDAALTAASQDYFTQTKCYMPKVEIEAEIAVLQAFAEYEDYQWVEQVSLGDTVYLYNPNIGVGVEDGTYDPLPIRVRTIEWDCIHDRASRIVARSEESSTNYSGASASVGSNGTAQESGTCLQMSGGTKSLVSGTSWNEVYSFTLQPGAWIVVCSCGFASNATGRRGFCLSTTSGGSQAGHNVLKTSNAVSGTYTELQFTFPIVVNEETTYFLSAYQNSGSALNAFPRVHAMKLN